VVEVFDVFFESIFFQKGLTWKQLLRLHAFF
jgi:hypothetical protein